MVVPKFANICMYHVTPLKYMETLFVVDLLISNRSGSKTTK